MLIDGGGETPYYMYVVGNWLGKLMCSEKVALFPGPLEAVAVSELSGYLPRWDTHGTHDKLMGWEKSGPSP